MNTEATRHPDWIPVEPKDGTIRGGDRYRVERSGGAAYEFDASYDWEQKDFIPDATYFVWPRPKQQPYEAIPEGKENAAVMAVSVDDRAPVVGTYYRDGATIYGIDPEGAHYVCDADRITSAVPVTVVPTVALTRLRGQKGADGLGATTPQAIAAFLAAVDGADQ